MAAPHAGERLKSQRATASPAVSTRPEVAFTSRKLIATRRPIWVDPKLELIPVPMADIDRAKVFYVEQVGFRLDHDVRPSAMVRVVHLVVAGVADARAALAGRGVAMGEIQDLGSVGYAGFRGPAGNTWTLQEIAGRPQRV